MNNTDWIGAIALTAVCLLCMIILAIGRIEESVTRGEFIIGNPPTVNRIFMVKAGMTPQRLIIIVYNISICCNMSCYIVSCMNFIFV